ncbi:hypothetical protein NPIL_89421 [Nephila pilipes]|uniref:Spider venom protein n=1 Tax=Nephila pilipes TaxID=299642 RepID=A0A8X6N1G0_NEPPI|nr:hypothetical protein NPIL_89421 [Nephila pilipes]
MKTIIYLAIVSALVGYVLSEDMFDDEDLLLDEEHSDLYEIDQDLNDENSERSDKCIPEYHDCTKNKHGCCRSSHFKYKCKCFYVEGKNGQETNKEKCTCQLSRSSRFLEDVFGKFGKR